MKFEKELRKYMEKALPEWRDKYLCYKLLKKILKKNLPPQTSAVALHELEESFIGILNQELEKFNDFYVAKEWEFNMRFQALKERLERLKKRRGKGRTSMSKSEFITEIDIQKDFVIIHAEMLLLKNYSSLNFAGLVKILKKYDKRTGRLLRIRFTPLVFRQPFLITESLTRLVLECQENLEIYFPVEAEIVDPNFNEPQVKNAKHAPLEAAVLLGEENANLQRNTKAAIRAMQSLRRESSTPNPFSFSSCFENQDNGAVIGESSCCDSSVIVENNDEEDEDVLK